MDRLMDYTDSTTGTLEFRLWFVNKLDDDFISTFLSQNWFAQLKTPTHMH